MPKSENMDTVEIKSPCIKNCCLNEEDICLGCCRSLDEILAWHQADQNEKKSIVYNCAQRSKAKFS